MRFTVEQLQRWNPGLEPLVAESRALPGVPPDEARPFQNWVDATVERIRRGEIPALLACEDGLPVGLISYTRRRSVIRVHYLYMRTDHHEPVSEFLLRAERAWGPARRIIVEGGPQTLLDEAVGADGFLEAGYRRFERARLELELDEGLPATRDANIVPLPMDDEEALIDLQRVGYLGSPDFLLIDDFEDMVHEMLNDPLLVPEASFAVVEDGRPEAALYTYRKGPLAWVASLCVRPEARGRRLAGRLMRHALDAYRSMGFGRAGLHVTLANRPAVRLYEKMGFHLAERISLLYAKETAFWSDAPPASAHETAVPDEP